MREGAKHVERKKVDTVDWNDVVVVLGDGVDGVVAKHDVAKHDVVDDADRANLMVG